jgi:predicted dehydrogenase
MVAKQVYFTGAMMSNLLSRRHFLRNCGLMALTVGSGSLIPALAQQRNPNEKLNIALIGLGSMGRTHSNAWSQVNRFFTPPLKSVTHTIFGLPNENPKVFAEHWGWQNASTDWETLVKLPEIGLVDIVTPNFMHAPPALAALAAGKPCACEKPIAGTLSDARKMAEAAKKANVDTFVWYNYRRAPAVALAHKMVKDGVIGDIRHVRATYLQDWATEGVPLSWRFKKDLAGSGSHGDLNAHIVDMTRFVTGLEVETICGAVAKTFVKQRKDGDKMSDVTVDDTVLFTVEYNNGAVGSYEAARQATGNKNANAWEINGTKGAFKFNFERMNTLEYFDATRPGAVQGWTPIMCTRGGEHPYAANYWGDAHIIGYEHCFINMAYDILLKLAGQTPTVPLPDFEDAYQTQRVLEAAMIAAAEKHWVELKDVK